MKNIYSHLQFIDFVVVGIYVIILIGIGYWASFIQNRKKNQNLFLAGKSLTWVSIGLTMWGTNIGPSMLIAAAASGFSVGIAGANFSWYAFIFIFLLSFVFAPFYDKTGVSTLPEFIGKRYNETSRSILAWYSMITIVISWLGMTLYAGGLLMSQILNLPLWLSIVSLVAISAFFTIAGGLKAIAYTNVFQMGLLIVVSMALTIVGVVKAGGPVAVYEAAPDSFWKLFLSNDNQDYPWLAILLGYPVLGIWFWCTDQSMVQSVLGAKNMRQGQLGTNFTGWLKILDMPLFILPGILCLILFPDIATPEEAYGTMVVNLFPNGMIGLIMAVLIAALISTIDSALNSLSTIFTLDIYVKSFGQKTSQKQIITIGRVVTAIGSILGIIIALLISTIKNTDLFMLFQSILGYLAPPMAAIFVMGVIWKKTTPTSANIILLVGSAISIGIGILQLTNLVDVSFLPHPLMMSFYLFVAMLVIMVVISAFSWGKYTGSDLPVVSEIQYKEVKGLRKTILLWTILSATMIFLYFVFN
jgi:solute:Na+ symporter, SSS family